MINPATTASAKLRRTVRYNSDVNMIWLLLSRSTPTGSVPEEVAYLADKWLEETLVRHSCLTGVKHLYSYTFGV